MPQNYAAAAVTIELDSAPLKRELMAQLEQLVVDDHLHLPDMFTLRFRDPNRDVFRRLAVRIGSRVKIAAGAVATDTTSPLIEAEVTALEADHGRFGNCVVIRGYDPSHRLHGGRRTETYRNVKVSDVARTVAGRAGLTIGTVEESDGVIEHISQANLTDWEFLKGLARENGFEVAVIDGRFDFRRPVHSSGAPAEATDYRDQNPLQLVFGTSLLMFQPRVSSLAQVTQVQARGWDPEQKQAVIGNAKAAASHAKLSSTPAGVVQPFGDRTHVVVDRPLANQGELDGVAGAVAEHIGSAFAEAEGTARGNPKLRAGTAISVAQAGDPFDGRYTLTHTRHVFDSEYLTQFTVSGRCDRSLLGLTSLGASNGSASGGGAPIYGMVIAQVTDNNDPNAQGRLKLKFPWLSDSYETDWCRMVHVGAGTDRGLVFIPEVNDEVLVAFEFGDVRRPYVIGGLHNGRDKPKLGDGLFDNGKVKRRGMVSSKGHRFVMFDDDSKSGMALMTSNSNLKVSLNESNNQITIHCQGAVQIKTDTGDVTVAGGANVTVQAQQQLTLKGPAGVTIDGGSGMVQVSGSQIMLG